MHSFYVDSANSLYSTVTNSAQDIATDLDSSKLYVFISNTNCWIKQGSAPSASAGAGSKFCGANEVVIIHGGFGDHLSVIRDTADGKATVTPITVVR